MNLSAVILAGGESRRMGRDKAWLELNGRPLIARALDTIRDSGIQEVFVSGRAGIDYSNLGCPVLLDREPGWGPLAGVEQALETAITPLILVLAVDMPNMTAAFLRKLAAHCETLTGAIPRWRGQLEPLAAIYPKRCRFVARDCLIRYRLAARDFAEACLRERALRTVAVSQSDSACFDNWNSASDMSGSPGAKAR